MDNIFPERLWRSLKYEEVYLHAYASFAKAKAGGRCSGCASTTRNGSIRALATARRGRSGETLAFAHIPTGTTANKGLDTHHKSKFVELTIALTAIGPTPKSDRATP